MIIPSIDNIQSLKRSKYKPKIYTGTYRGRRHIGEVAFILKDKNGFGGCSYMAGDGFKQCQLRRLEAMIVEVYGRIYEIK